MTRIIGGSAGGRRLLVPASGTRPTSDRVREAMFSTIDSQLLAGDGSWSELDVLDLFAGSGALGLEAVSRGARSAVLVEKARPSARVAASNADLVDAAKVRVLIHDARLLSTAPAPEQRPSLCFADPPYDWRAADIALLLSDLHICGWIGDGALVIVERPGKDQASPMPGDWAEPTRRAYGDTALWYGRAKSASHAQTANQETSA